MHECHNSHSSSFKIIIYAYHTLGRNDAASMQVIQRWTKWSGHFQRGIGSTRGRHRAIAKVNYRSQRSLFQLVLFHDFPSKKSTLFFPDFPGLKPVLSQQIHACESYSWPVTFYQQVCTTQKVFRGIVYYWKTTGTPSHYKNMPVIKLHILKIDKYMGRSY